MKEYYCTICGRKHNGKYASKYCRKHQWQLNTYGKFLDYNPRTKFDPNEFRFLDNNVVEFDVYDSPSCNVIKTFKIDAEDYPIVSKYKWSLDIGGYARTTSNSIKLHRIIMNAKLGQQVDHLNLDITDNRKINLRICGNSLNSSNRAGYNKLNIKGIEYHKNQNKYSAYFRINDKQYHSPCFNSKEEAAFARFILEQMFREEELTQFSSELINTLSEEIKSNIIDAIKKKFNK
jgi:hypothetical protein